MSFLESPLKIKKGNFGVLTLNESQVEGLLDNSDMLEALTDGFKAIAGGKFKSPQGLRSKWPGKGMFCSCLPTSPVCRSQSRM